MAKLSDIVKVNISKDPLLNLDRTAFGTVFHVTDGHIDLTVLVRLYKNNVEVINDRIKPYSLTLSAQNSTLVNPDTGGTVEDGEAVEDCTMGEYDYLTMVANNPLNIFDLMKSVIARADVRGRYNK